MQHSCLWLNRGYPNTTISAGRTGIGRDHPDASICLCLLICLPLG